jgi:hypothetical protein
MPYIQLDGGVVVGVYPNPQPGFAEEWREDDDADVLAYLAPAPAEPHLNGGGLARFSGTLPAVLHEAIRMAAVTRISKGRYRVTHEEAMPSDQYSVGLAVMDANPRTIRYTARTSNYVEVRVTDLAGAVQDPTEITVQTQRVVNP